MEKALYLFTGFLEAGKTKFVSDTLSDPNFNDGKRKYLVLMCEEGEEEYDPESYGDNVRFAAVDTEAELTRDFLTKKASEADADIIVVEYNGMWMLDTLYSALPEDWLVYQEMLIADATTVESYNANMRQLVVDKLTSAEMVVFNRTDEKTDKPALHRLVRGVSRKANICYEDREGNIEFDDIEDPLPYDINAPVIEVTDENFAIFYRDMTEEFQKYNGKCVRFKGIVALDATLPKGHYAIGRHIMTCCADDIAYRGVVAKGTSGLALKTRDWITVEGVLTEEYSKLYRAKGPVLAVKEAKRAEKPIQEVATFY